MSVLATTQSDVSMQRVDAGPPVKAEATQVVVDVVVLDGHDRAVKGLRHEDFRILENNKAQQIVSFEVHEALPRPSSPRPPRLPQNSFTNGGSRGTGAINVILLDQLNTAIGDQELARVELIKFFEHKPPGSRFAIFASRGGTRLCISCDSLRMVQGITGDQERLIAALNSREVQPQPPPPQVQVALGQVEDTTMPSLAEIGQFLKDLPGRKNLIWLSGNFDAAPVAQFADIWFPPKFKGWQNVDPLSKIQVLHLAAGRLGLARVAIYPIDLTGKNKKITVQRICEKVEYAEDQAVGLYWDVCEQVGPKLDTIAAQSGGRAFHDPTKIQEALARAVADQADYYTLAYSPRDSKLDGKVRTIKIGIDRQNCRLQYRRRYFADDPASLNRPSGTSSPDIVVPNPAALRINPPFKIARLSFENSSQTADPEEPLMAAMRYGAPSSRGIVFLVHVAAEAKTVQATPEQMKQLQDFESFRAERAAKATQDSEKQKKRKRKDQVVFDSLPAPDPVLLQRYVIDFSLAAEQLTVKAVDQGKNTSELELAVLAYDQLGKRVAGFKAATSLTIDSAELNQFLASDYRQRQIVDVPTRASVLRFAIRDVGSNRVGSFEVPAWAIYNPYQRRRLPFPTDLDAAPRKPRVSESDAQPRR